MVMRLTEFLTCMYIVELVEIIIDLPLGFPPNNIIFLELVAKEMFNFIIKNFILQ